MLVLFFYFICNCYLYLIIHCVWLQTSETFRVVCWIHEAEQLFQILFSVCPEKSVVPYKMVTWRGWWVCDVRFCFEIPKNYSGIDVQFHKLLKSPTAETQYIVLSKNVMISYHLWISLHYDSLHLILSI